MLAAPVATGRTHAALHFVENEKHLVFIANATQRLEPFTAKMIVAAFALDRLDDDGADVSAALRNREPDFLLRFFLSQKNSF